MRVLGIDYGDRHVGLALSDPLQVTAQPFGTYTLTGREKEDRKFFQDLVARHDVQEIVIGDPLRMDGSSGTGSRRRGSSPPGWKRPSGSPSSSSMSA
jgi:putative Holliday junction resolvase